MTLQMLLYPQECMRHLSSRTRPVTIFFSSFFLSLSLGLESLCSKSLACRQQPNCAHWKVLQVTCSKLYCQAWLGGLVVGQQYCDLHSTGTARNLLYLPASFNIAAVTMLGACHYRLVTLSQQ